MLEGKEKNTRIK